ncbi:TetR family transcriptional regulator [Amycolatopsis sp. AA4]|uniref:TetR-like C-terminal domain-containing protein n=1 Tax=Actinomycetes TaxID=1760 RepID=UPI0001DEE349|nr:MULTISPECIES: TetR-like C-terminal domain-containing protein [Actinomycetes]ATY12341.1 TetR family transcriptional regulator [Amycolatopsis sp. AA4]EFL08089.1 transcriptional regulator [Streptomyces sp. AA4]
MSDAEVRRRPGGRAARVRAAVLHATNDLLLDQGLTGLKVSEVAQRAQVNETTIFRRWGTRENLVIDALLADAAEQLPVPDTGTLREDLLVYATALAEYLASPAGNALDRTLASAGDDPATQELRDKYWEARYAQSGQIAERAIQRGELPEGTEPRFVLEMLVAPLHFRIVLTREPLDADLPARIVDTLLGGLGTGSQLS